MASVGVLRVVLMLRILTLLILTASVVVMALNNVTFDDENGFKIKFTDFIAYRYVLGVGCSGILYTIIQLPLAMYNVVQEKRLIRNGCLSEFDYYGDKVIALLLASGVGAGFGLTCEMKRGHGLLGPFKKYLNWANISTGLLLGGVVFMALLLAFSSARRSAKKGLY